MKEKGEKEGGRSEGLEYREGASRGHTPGKPTEQKAARETRASQRPRADTLGLVGKVRVFVSPAGYTRACRKPANNERLLARNNATFAYGTWVSAMAGTIKP